MRKNIKNYTSDVPVIRSLNNIQVLLSKKGANKIMVDYEAGEPIGIMFTINTPRGYMPVRLPARIEGVAKVMCGARLNQLNERALKQVQRTAWKNIYDWVDAQLALLETEMVKLEEIFLPYVVMRDNKTTFELFEGGNLLPSGGQHD